MARAYLPEAEIVRQLLEHYRNFCASIFCSAITEALPMPRNGLDAFRRFGPRRGRGPCRSMGQIRMASGSTPAAI